MGMDHHPCRSGCVCQPDCYQLCELTRVTRPSFLPTGTSTTRFFTVWVLWVAMCYQELMSAVNGLLVLLVFSNLITSAFTHNHWETRWQSLHEPCCMLMLNRQMRDQFIAFLYKGWRQLCTCTYMYIYVAALGRKRTLFRLGQKWVSDATRSLGASPTLCRTQR